MKTPKWDLLKFNIITIVLILDCAEDRKIRPGLEPTSPFSSYRASSEILSWKISNGVALFGTGSCAMSATVRFPVGNSWLVRPGSNQVILLAIKFSSQVAGFELRSLKTKSKARSGPARYLAFSLLQNDIIGELASHQPLATSN